MKSKISRFFVRLLTLPFFKNLGLSKSFGALGLIFAQGAPVGYVIHEHFFGDLPWGEVDLSAFIYIWVGTSFFFTFFGYITGLLAEELATHLKSLEQVILLNQHYEKSQKQFYLGLLDHFRTPLSVAIEFLDTFQNGIYGKITHEQASLSHSVVSELKKLDQTFREMLTYKNLHRAGLQEIKHINMKEFLVHTLETPPRHIEFVNNIDPILEVDPKLLEIAFEQLIQHAMMQVPLEKFKISILGESGTQLEKRVPSENLLPVVGIDPSAEYLSIQIHLPAHNRVELVAALGEPHLQLGIHLVKKIAEWHGGNFWTEIHGKEGMTLNFSILKRQSYLGSKAA